MNRNVLLLEGAAVIHAQGFTGPGAPPSPPGGPGFSPQPPHPGPEHNPPPPGFGPCAPPPHPGPGHKPPPPPGFQGDQGQYGFTGPARTVAVEQVKTFAHRTPVVITGTVVQFIGADCYTFRDPSGEITLRIGPREWAAFGGTVSPSCAVEIGGELHRDTSDPAREPEVRARSIRKL